MKNLSAASRHSNLANMAESPLDVLVIGGGITGAGIALDAVARGYRVGLVEQRDFASGTSGRSTKLVHGGIRYLPEFDIPLVHEALIERGRLLRNAPHLVRPLSFILPLYASSRHPVGLPIAPPGGIGLGRILDAGLFAYDQLAGRENVGRHRRISREEVLERARCLVPEGLKTGFIYYDAQTDDSRLTMAVLRSAADRRALIANYAKVVGFKREDDRAVGVYVRDALDGCVTGTSEHEMLIRAKHIVNATGVWAEEVERLARDTLDLHIVPSKGTHLVFSKEVLDIGEEATVLPETEDGRIIFIVPWLSRVLVGTTDTTATCIDNPVASDDDITYLLGHLNRYVQRKLEREDIVATYAGYRPLLQLRAKRTPARLSRTHAVVEGRDGLLTISGGKLTTYRSMAQDVVDRIDVREGRARTDPTVRMPLMGAEGWAEAQQELHHRGRSFGLAQDVIDHLDRAYGAEALAVLKLAEDDRDLARWLIRDLPYIRAEVVYACRAELALTIEDVLDRRTHIAIEDRSRGLDVVEDVAALMGVELGWPESERARQVADYTRFAVEQAGPLALSLTAGGTLSHAEATDQVKAESVTPPGPDLLPLEGTSQKSSTISQQ